MGDAVLSTNSALSRAAVGGRVVPGVMLCPHPAVGGCRCLLPASSASSSSSSKVAQMAQTGGININSLQISIETELEMEDPMQLEPSSSFPHTAIPSIIPEPFIKPGELGRGHQQSPAKCYQRDPRFIHHPHTPNIQPHTAPTALLHLACTQF